jgi:rRNA maturation RNase YbeY
MLSETLEIYNESKSISEKDMLLLSDKFFEIKNRILGKDFFLSVSFLSSKNAQKINRKQRKQSYIPNTLSFKYSKSSGEIILTPEIISKENYEIPHQTKNKKTQTLNIKLIYLFIHSCLHLTDLDHGSKMDKLEEKYVGLFVI